MASTTMNNSSVESIQDDAHLHARHPDTADETSSEQPKLKGRKKLMASLQRISSSPSFARLSRSRSNSNSYRGIGQGSMSCISLSSSSYNNGLGHAFQSPYTTGYSTAPTSVPGTPALERSGSQRIRFVQDINLGRPRAATSVPLPSDIRPFSRCATPLATISAEEDYFSGHFSQPIEEEIAPAPKIDFWGDMPAEIKMQVLRLLTFKEIVRSSLVSKAWHDMCFDGQLWANMDTADFYSKIPAEALIKIVKQAGPFVRDLNLRGCVQLRDTWKSAGLQEACRNLENLSLEGCAIDRTSINSFVGRNYSLIHINVSGLAASNSTMRAIANSCPRLKYLNIDWCNRIDHGGLLRVLEACPNLCDLRASEVGGFGELNLMNEIFKRNTLERFILVNCSSLTDDSLKALMEGVGNEIDVLTGRAIVPPRNLRHLDISRCRNITDAGVKSLVEHVPLLEGLQLGRLHSLTDDSLMPLLPTLPNLTHLDLEELESLTNATLQVLATSSCSAVLQHLSISYCELLGDVGMLPIIRACGNLRNLDLDNTRISDLVLAEAAAMVRQRSSFVTYPSFSTNNPAILQRPRAVTWDGGSAPNSNSIATGPADPKIGLRMVVYDCQNVTWTGIREVLSRNAEIRRPMAPSFFVPSFAPATTATSQAHALADTVNSTSSVEDAVRTTTIRNVEAPRFHAASAPSHPHQIISLKVFYGYQPTVTEHTRRVLRGDLASASRLERKWAEYMIASEEASAAMGAGTGNGLGRFGVANGIGNATVGLGMLGNRRRRRRVREAQMMHADEEEGGMGGGGRRRRARSNGGCAMM